MWLCLDSPAAERDCKVRLAVPLDIAIPLEGGDTTSNAKASDGPSEVDRSSREARPNLAAALRYEGSELTKSSGPLP